jgi:hypothetical protein
MKNSLLEHIIRNVLAEATIRTPVVIKGLYGADKSDYEAAGAIFGFDVKTIAKRVNKERLSNDELLEKVNRAIQENPANKPIQDFVNRDNMIAVVSGDFRASARVYSFRVWIFEEQYLDFQLRMLPLNEKGVQLSTSTPLYQISTPEDRFVGGIGFSKFLGKAGVQFFENGEKYANLNYAIKYKDTLDLNGLREYEDWYNKLKKINKTLPTVTFKMPDIDKLPDSSSEGQVDDKIYMVDENPQYYADVNGESVPISSKLENEEIQIQQYIGSTKDETMKTFLFTGDIIDDKYQNDGIIEYVGSVTDSDTMNPIFIGTLRIKNITSTYDVEYIFWMGSLTNYKMWQGNENVNTQEAVLNGAVKDGEILGSSKITTPAGKTKTWDEVFKK